MTDGVFITGTDTGVGKTAVAVALVRGWIARGFKVAAMKPVATGAELSSGELRNEDAILLREAMSIEAAYQQVNPYVFARPVAPHLAAAAAGVEIELTRIQTAFCWLAERCDRIVVEGAGGWLVPLNHRASMATLALQLQLPVILVTSIRLGCINHALLTLDSMSNTGVQVLGWIANLQHPDTELAAENIDSIQQRTRAPLLATIPYQGGPGVTMSLDLEALEKAIFPA